MSIFKKQNVLHVDTDTGGVYLPQVPYEAMAQECEFVAVTCNKKTEVFEVEVNFLHILENKIRDFLRSVEPTFPVPLR